MAESFATTASAADWREWTGSNVTVTSGGLTVRTTTDVDRSQVGGGAVAVAGGREGGVTVVGDDGPCVRRDPEMGRCERLCTDPPWRDPVAACGSGGRVVVADASDGTVAVVSARRRRPRGVRTDATDPVGVALAGGRIAVLDGDGRVLATRQGYPSDTVLDRTEGPIDVAGTDGRLFVLCDWEDGGVLRCYDATAGTVTNSVALPSSLTPRAVAAGQTGPVVAGTVDGDDTLVGDADGDAFQRRCGVEGQCHALAAAGPGVVYGVFGDSGRVERIAERERPARHPHRDGRVGTACYRYDAGSDGTDWHRVRVVASGRSPSRRVRLHYRGTDEDRDTAWPGDGGDWTTIDVADGEDFRLRETTGRYLHLRLELVGTAEAAPRVDRVRAFCDRDPIGQYLPDQYDAVSSDALDGFLMAFETFFEGVEADIDGLTEYLDPTAAPSEALSWLESWFAVEGTEDWPESARRELLARAPDLYRKRGTEAGVRAMIDLYRRHAETPVETDPEERSDERGRDRATPFFLGTADFERVQDAPDREALAGALPGGADVVCYCAPFETADGREAVEEIVGWETPAHVRTEVAPLERSCSLDGSTFLGHNSRLTRRAFEVGTASLDGSSALEPTTRHGSHTETRARIEDYR